MGYNYVLFAFYIEFSSVPHDERILVKEINRAVSRYLTGKWIIEEEWRPTRPSKNGLEIGYLTIPSTLKTRSNAEAWIEANLLMKEISSGLAISRKQILVEPYTDLGFSPDIRNHGLLESTPAVKSVGLTFDPDTKNNKWSVDQIHALEAHSQFKVSGNGLRIGLLDTGHTLHKEIIDEGKMKLALGWNTYEDELDTSDPMKSSFKITEPVRLPGHGTSTASILTSQIKSKDKTTTDIIGVSPGAEIVPFRIGNSAVLSSKRLRRSVAKAINKAQEKSCDVLSLSVGYIAGDIDLRKAVDDATDKGIIIVSAAGQVPPLFSAPNWLNAKPATYRNTIAVAASNVKKNPCDWSFRGSWVDVIAPGEGVWRAYWQKKEGEIMGKAIGKRSLGTSYATPHVAGVAALWLERWSQELEEVVKAKRTELFRFVLQKCGLEKKGDEWGAGIVDAVKVLNFPWQVNDAWEIHQESLPTVPRQYTWQEELSLDMYEISPDQVPFNEFAGGTEKTLLESFNVNDNEMEEFLDENYPELIFHLRSNNNDRQIFLSRLALNLSTTPESVGLKDTPLVREAFGESTFLESSSANIQSRLAD